MRERIEDNGQASYWDSIADSYQEETRISCDDFHYGPQIPGESVLRLLPAFGKGMTALEIGCGGAQNSIWLARRGVACTAFDVSAGQLAHARELVWRERAQVELVRGGFGDFRGEVGGRLFDFVHSSHAIEFVEDPRGAVADMAACVKPGGWMMVSTVHPLYNGEWISLDLEDGAGERDGEFLTSYFEPPDDIRDEQGEHVVSRAYPVSAWFRWMREAGLEVTALEEPAAVVDAPYSSDGWAGHDGQLDAIPSTVILVARKLV